MKSTQNVC